MLLFAWVEINRYQDYKNPGSVNRDPIFTNNALGPNTPGYRPDWLKRCFMAWSAMGLPHSQVPRV